MKKPKKMKLIAEIVEILKKDDKEVNHSTVSSWVMSQVHTHSYNEVRYGGLRQGDFSLYFREYYAQEA